MDLVRSVLRWDGDLNWRSMAALLVPCRVPLSIGSDRLAFLCVKPRETDRDTKIVAIFGNDGKDGIKVVIVGGGHSRCSLCCGARARVLGAD